VVFAVVMIMIVWAMIGEGRQRRRVVMPPPPPGTGAMPTKETYGDLVVSLGEKVKDQEKKLADAEEQNKQLKEALSQNEEKITEILKKVIERMSDLEQASANANKEQGGPVDVSGEPIKQLPEDGLNRWGEMDTAPIEAPKPPERKKVAIIGAGDSVRVRLLAGVNAPTDGTPYPVVFELADDVVGPDASALPLGGARVIAAAQGSLTDSRALFRLTTINIRFPDGSRKILNVDGWVVGEDGIRGMEGILIDPIGKALAGSMMSGVVQGFGSGVAAANSRTVYYGNGSSATFVDGDVSQYAVGRGVEKMGDRWSKYIDERMSLLVPHVKVLSGRKATAVFSQSVMIEGLFDSMEDEELVLASLD
jgi:hypothetical protein